MAILDPKEGPVGTVDFSGTRGPYAVIEIDANGTNPSVKEFTNIVKEFCIEK